jgi:hypothetical protein
MRKVILEDKKELRLSDLNDNSIVGILWQDNEKTTYLNFEGRLIEVCNFKNDAMVTSKNIQMYISTSVSISEVYVFDTMKKCFKWLSE